MYTPERACDARTMDAQAFGVCVSEQRHMTCGERAKARAHFLTLTAVQGGMVEGLTFLIRKASRNWDDVDPITTEHATAIAKTLLGQ